MSVGALCGLAVAVALATGAGRLLHGAGNTVVTGGFWGLGSEGRKEAELLSDPEDLAVSYAL